MFSLVGRSGGFGNLVRRNTIASQPIRNFSSAPTFNRQQFNSTDSLHRALRLDYLKQGHNLRQANQFALQNANSFVQNSPVTRTESIPGDEILAIGSDTYANASPPTATYTADYDQLFNGGLKSPKTLQDELALPSSNEANTLYRVLTEKNVPRYRGTVGPQGYDGSSVFKTPSPGGGTQYVTPGGTFNTPKGQVNLSVERIPRGNEQDAAGRRPQDDIQ